MLYRTLLIATACLAGLSSMLVAEAVPRTIGFDGADLARVKQAMKAGDDRFAGHLQRITTEAQKALEAGPFSVMDKAYVAPSGDKHDYASLSPYWWPDPSKPDGLPYIRRDGEVNPERSKYDLNALESMTEAVWDLGLAYYLTDDEAYARKAAELLRVWFLDPRTRMNPNVKYAQFRPGRPLAPSGVIETTRLMPVLDAIRLIESSPHWTEADSTGMEQWVRQFIEYLRTSEQGIAESKQPNNHGTWYAVQVAGFALFVGDEALAKQVIETHGRQRIASQIEPDGSQPHELARTRPYHYSRYNLKALMDLARLGEHVGVDLWHYRTEDGRSLRAALDYLVPFATGEKPLERDELSPPRFSDFHPLLRWAGQKYNEPSYEQAIDRIKGVDRRTSLVEVLWPIWP